MNIYRFIMNKIVMLINELRLFHIFLMGVKLGKKVKIYGKVNLKYHDKLSIGNYVTLNEGVYITCQYGVNIGNYVRLSPHVQIHSSKLDINTFPRVHTGGEININDNVWIASGAVISANVTIGENSIIAANSVVVNDVESNSLYAGNPAKKILSLKS